MRSIHRSSGLLDSLLNLGHARDKLCLRFLQNSNDVDTKCVVNLAYVVVVPSLLSQLFALPVKPKIRRLLSSDADDALKRDSVKPAAPLALLRVSNTAKGVFSVPNSRIESLYAAAKIKFSKPMVAIAVTVLVVVQSQKRSFLPLIMFTMMGLPIVVKWVEDWEHIDG